MSGDDKPTIVGLLGGVVVGVVVFLGVNITSGWAIVPTRESVTNKSWGLSKPKYPEVEVAPAGAGGVYQTTCQTCHQAEGEGVTGAFPPLAGSEWVTGDPETPIRIVLLGLKGEIDVKGTKYNSLMPPPPGMTDEKVVEAVNHVRTSFGNNASEIDLELVQKVKASIGDRTDPWTAAELTALRASAGAEAEADAEGAAGAEGAAPAEGEADAERAAPAEGEGGTEGEAPGAEAEPAAAPGPAAEPAPEPGQAQ